MNRQEVDKGLKKDKVYSVLRFVSGTQTITAFHYDKKVIIVLVTISIPKIDINKSGHLIAFPPDFLI